MSSAAFTSCKPISLLSECNAGNNRDSDRDSCEIHGATASEFRNRGLLMHPPTRQCSVKQLVESGQHPINYNGKVREE